MEYWFLLLLLTGLKTLSFISGFILTARLLSGLGSFNVDELTSKPFVVQLPLSLLQCAGWSLDMDRSHPHPANYL